MQRNCSRLASRYGNFYRFAGYRSFSSTEPKIGAENVSEKQLEEPENPMNRPMLSIRYLEFREKLRTHTPPDMDIEMDPEMDPNPAHEMEPLKPWPNSTNPYTGEIGGPAGPEPTRYGDWERKGRVSDF
ncbi:hypothetical protein KR018_004820 [Drosophila ironensis]|nr:hypothetical protein KR018_004820 [Drosophila ironensis]